MSARPIIPGRIYAVRGLGIEANVLADNGCTAILIGLQLAGVLPCEAA
jgi:hypothetical protein